MQLSLFKFSQIRLALLSEVHVCISRGACNVLLPHCLGSCPFREGIVDLHPIQDMPLRLQDTEIGPRL